jgi:hypothetical protein
MDTKTYNRSNFHRHTFCVFREAALAEIENRSPNYTSKSGSSYYFTDDGVYRLSHHWGRAANCKWRLESDNLSAARMKLGFAKWSSFHKDNDTEKLYFITVDFETNKVNYQHKDSETYEEGLVVRTATATTKHIKTIRELLTQEAWAKHFDGKTIEELRTVIVSQLLTTNLTLHEIKNKIRESL